MNPSLGAVPIAQLAQLPQNTSPGPALQSAIIGGNEQYGSNLYLCAAYIESAHHYLPGKTRPGLGGCSVGYQGTEMIVGTYSFRGYACFLVVDDVGCARACRHLLF
jgi:hypothetical protein